LTGRLQQLTTSTSLRDEGQRSLQFLQLFSGQPLCWRPHPQSFSTSAAHNQSFMLDYITYTPSFVKLSSISPQYHNARLLPHYGIHHHNLPRSNLRIPHDLHRYKLQVQVHQSRRQLLSSLGSLEPLECLLQYWERGCFYGGEKPSQLKVCIIIAAVVDAAATTPIPKPNLKRVRMTASYVRALRS